MSDPAVPVPAADTDGPGRLDAGGAGPRFIRGAGLRVAGFVIGTGLGAIITPFVTRHLGPVGWGRYVTAGSVLFITVAIIEGGLSNMGVREFSTESRARRDEYMSALLALRVVLCAVGSVGVLGFAWLVGYRSILVAGIAIGCVGMLLSTLQATLAIVLTARLDLGWQTLVDFSGQVVSALALMSLVLLGAPLLPFFAVTSLVAAVTLTFTAFTVRRHVTVRLVLAPRLWVSLLRQSGIYAAAAALGVVYFQVVAVAITLFADGRQTGYFDLGFRILSLLNSVPWLLVTGAFPILSRAASDDHDRLRFAHQRLVEAALTIGGWVSISVVVGAPFIVTVIGGSRFAPAVPVLRIVGAGMVGTYLLATWSFTLLSLSLFRQLIVANAVAVGAAVVLSVVLIPPLGADGAAIVTASLELLLAAAYLVGLLRRMPEMRLRLDPLVRITMALGGALLIALLCPVPAVARVIIETVVLGVLLWRLGAIPEDLLRALLRRQPAAVSAAGGATGQA